MRLDTLFPTEGPRKAGERLDRGIGSGLGRTGGCGHKGQKSRSGGSVRRGFEGSQMPPYRYPSEFGFTSHRVMITAETRLPDPAHAEDDVVDLSALKAANIIGVRIKLAKVILSGKVACPVIARSLCATRGARATIEAAGGKIER